MSTWRRKAIEYLPEHREIVDRARTPMAMWIELHLRFEDAVEDGDQHMVKRFLRYADWCMSEEAGRLPSETSTATACAFYEHLPQRRDTGRSFAAGSHISSLRTLFRSSATT
ncbi:hypothetical protein [Dyella sp.]|uniref:hypothetical protein n=1 Tax=Dyella sp. TaxID=1869338 RepID=UPI002848A4A3|nr:hypothetical protein [Dyella sp.]MDR3447959.1 hypothetical protein [Dyella sp.]